MSEPIALSSSLKPFSERQMLKWSELKIFADVNINMTLKSRFDLDRVENIVGKGENTGSPTFSCFPAMYTKAFFLCVLKKSLDCVVKG